MIIETQKNVFNITASANANWLIYCFKSIPLIGKLLPDSIYEELLLKKIAAVLATVLKSIGKIFGKAIYVGLLFALPAVLITEDTALRHSLYLHIFAVICMISPFMTSFVFKADRDRYICIRLMRMNARDYFLSTLAFHEILNSLFFLPVVLLATVCMGGTLAEGLLLTVVSAAFSLFGEAFFLFIYSHTGIMLNQKVLYSVSCVVLCLAAAYVPAFLHRPFLSGSLLFHPAFLLALLIVVVLCVGVILKFDRFQEAAAVVLKASDFTVDTKKAINEAKFADVAVKEKEFKEADLKTHRFECKKGFAYLNSLFYERHKRILVKPVLIELVIVVVLFAVAIAAALYVPDFLELLSVPGRVLPVLVFVMYFASGGERVCKAMFYNCDISLLRYPFYREKRAVLSNFKSRLIMIAALNLVVAAAISVAFLGLDIVFSLNWSVLDTVSFILSILLLSLFFSVHHLFLYYVFQPYTTELNMKNPFYSILNTVVYLVCYLCIQIKSPPSYFALIVLAATFVYIVTALILVYRFAPKNFRVK